MDELEGHEFDLIINATSSGISGDIPAIPSSLIHPAFIAMTCSIRKEKLLFWHGVSSEAQSVMLMV